MSEDFHEIVLSVKHLTTKFVLNRQIISIVEDLSFDLFLGKTLALVGESGSGKSVSALSLMRLLPTPPFYKSEGEIIYKGKNLLTLKEKEMRKLRGGKIAMVFQDPHSALNPVFTIGYQLEEAALIHQNLYGEKAFCQVIESLKEVGIDKPELIYSSYPHELSGGMKQRVIIAMALIGKPDLLIADEPTTALDLTIQSQVLSLMKDLQKQKGMAILLITHDMDVVAKMADECLVLYAGQMVEKASIDELFKNPRHPYTEALLNARPDEKVLRGHLKAIKGMPPQMDQLPKGCRFHPRCPYAFEKCASKEPPLFYEKNSESASRCWLLESNIES